MTFRTSINSKENPRDLLKRGFKSMFSNYGEQVVSSPVDKDESRGQDKKER